MILQRAGTVRLRSSASVEDWITGMDKETKQTLQAYETPPEKDLTSDCAADAAGLIRLEEDRYRMLGLAPRAVLTGWSCRC